MSTGADSSTGRVGSGRGSALGSAGLMLAFVGATLALFVALVLLACALGALIFFSGSAFC